jgi:Calcineurin-like phosphoesterase
MKPHFVCAALAVAAVTAGSPSPVRCEPPSESFAFAVSGDSRDCGDLIMPKIARAVAGERPAVDFYWHLGDFRRMYDVDCDMVKRTFPGFDCKQRSWETLPDDTMETYLRTAWDDFIEHQVKPFGTLPVFLGIGNHELYGRTRDDFRRAFQPWLTQKRIHLQRLADSRNRIYSTGGDTSYHFVYKGTNFIYVDNADETSFTASQLVWLSKILAADAKNDTVRAIVVGMHEALPYSTNRGHAMDATCQGLCSGQIAYDLLFRAQNLSAPPEKQKKVYVFASHSHLYLENIYDTPEHKGQVLPGWIVGTAGAQQYTDTIAYGYARVDVGPAGSLGVKFREVTRASLPLATGEGADSLTDFCFVDNKQKPGSDAFQGDCACGAAR